MAQERERGQNQWAWGKIIVSGLGLMTGIGIVAWQIYKRRQLQTYQHHNIQKGRAVYFSRDEVTGKICEEECVICLENMALAQKLHVLPCAHTFHQSCIKMWARYDRTCPLCREPFAVD